MGLDSGGVGEEHPHEGDLGEELDDLLRNVRFEGVQPLGEQ
jgi:hypothetical protein